MTNSIEQIKSVALLLFTERGYEGTSLSDIAEGVGMKKQSIYSHFRNKDALFITIMEQVFQEEVVFIQEFFNQPYNNLQDILKSFILTLRDRFFHQENNNLTFVLRSSFIPATHLKEETIKNATSYFNEMEQIIRQLFSKSSLLNHQVDKITLSFMTILDGLFVALIYADKERFDQKFMSSWDIFWTGISDLPLEVKE